MINLDRMSKQVIEPFCGLRVMQSIRAKDQFLTQQLQGLNLLSTFFEGQPLGLGAHPPKLVLRLQYPTSGLGDGVHRLQAVGLAQL